MSLPHGGGAGVPSTPWLNFTTEAEEFEEATLAELKVKIMKVETEELQVEHEGNREYLAGRKIRLFRALARKT